MKEHGYNRRGQGPGKRRPGALRRWLPLALGLALLAAANLRPAYRVRVSGEALPELYSLRQTETCMAAARAAAEEILLEESGEPRLERRFCLCLGRPSGSEAALTDALLRSVPGIGVSDAVWVNGTRLGTVADGERLCALLRASILGQMPHAAVSGSISGQLSLERVYTRAGQDTPDRDMVLLITGMAPVIYVDEQGRLA